MKFVFSFLLLFLMIRRVRSMFYFLASDVGMMDLSYQENLGYMRRCSRTYLSCY